METITCNHCLKDKPDAEFNWRRKSIGMRQRTCRECQKTQKNSWYQRNKEKHKTNVAENKQEHINATRQHIYEYLSTHPCIDCGEADPKVLEFDHVRGQKRGTVSRMIANGFSVQVIQKEIEKCEVRCANCHKRKTSQQQSWFRESWK